MSAPVNPAGSCPANPTGPIADGSQLVDITQNPGVSGTTSSTGATGNSTVVTPSSGSNGATKSTATTSPSVAGSAIAAVSSTTSPSGGGFRLTNGQNAQKLNAQFATLTADSSCTGELVFLRVFFFF